jgi:hypothetical protein
MDKATIEAATPPSALDQADSAGDDMSQGYSISINVDGQGNITVGVETSSEERGEEPAVAGAEPDADPEQPDDGARPVANIKEALQVAGDIYRNAGQMTGGSQSDRAAFYAAGPKG